MAVEQVFPAFSVKQAMREVDIDREDDMIISSIQTDLTTRCLTAIIKGAVVSCAHNKRRYINERDIQYALSTTDFPISTVKSSDVGYLLDTRHLGMMCSMHIELIIDMLQRFGIDLETSMSGRTGRSGHSTDTIKVSAEVLLHLQEAIEQLVRGFFVVFKQEGDGKAYGYRLFDQVLNRICGDPMAEDSSFPSMSQK